MKTRQIEREREEKEDRALTWNMTLYCSSGFWTTHMLHPIVTFDTVLDCAGSQLPPGLTTSYTGTLSNKVFVCGSGRAPPSFAGVVVYYTASPQSNTQHIPARGRIYSLYGCVTVLLLLAHNSSDIIQRKLQCGDSFRAARMNVCFCLHCRHTHKKKNLGSGEKMCLRVLLVCACVIKLDEADKSMLILWLVERDHTVCLLHPALFAL